MKRGLTFFARGVVWLVGLGALAVCFILIPELAREDITAHPASAPTAYAFMIGAYVVAAPFFIALHHTLKLLRGIEQGKAFSSLSVQALKYIKYCAAAFAALVVVAVIAGMSLARSVDPSEDITGPVMLGFILTFASSVIATLAGVLQALFQSAIAIKSENDLTV
jgi:hypothetical protein